MRESKKLNIIVELLFSSILLFRRNLDFVYLDKDSLDSYGMTKLSFLLI